MCNNRKNKNLNI